jgi:pyruvate,water dikinase
MRSTALLIPFAEVTLADVALVGGKNASLGELLRGLSSAGVQVPDGFALTAEAFRRHLATGGLDREIEGALAGLDVNNVTALASCARGIRERIRALPLADELARQLHEAYAELSRRYGEPETDVAVRSSATAEDLPGASFAGQQETFLNVRGRAALERAVSDCMASLYTDRAIVYRAERGFRHADVALSVGVQKMVRSDLGAAGVVFTLDTETGFRDVVVITGAWGLGETVVQGRVDPDEIWVHKPTLEAGFPAIIRRERGDKKVKLVYATGGSRATVEVRVPGEDRRRLVLAEAEILLLARWALAIERHYSAVAGKPTPMDIEWARDGRTGQLFVVQARPETVHASRAPTVELWERKGTGAVLARGKAVGAGAASGPVRVVHHPAELASFRDGEVLVAPMTDPDWEPVLRRAAAVVTEHGGRTCHAAIVSRELGIPCVVGTGDATHALREGARVTVSCADGDEGHVYAGDVAYERRRFDAGQVPTPRVPVMLNVGDPRRAFVYGQLPSGGVGLARMEFIVSSSIGVHPMALVHPERIRDAGVRRRVLAAAADHATPPDMFVDRLADGIAQIAAAFWPRPILVRFSDFKTNEYAALLGGADFEPEEANPMIGFRGASRYYDPRYREAFALECRALRRVREQLGLTNVKAMVPFCRTLGEADRVLAELAQHGLVRGDKGFEVWVMCEIPANVILAEEFARRFDGFSIGSNDLTQLTLGVDRDSELLAPLFDEEDPAVKTLIGDVIRRAHAAGRRVGLCGQGPSDRVSFAAFLAEAGIDSISVTPDALFRVCEKLAAR